MYDHTLHHERSYSCRLQTFSTAEILKSNFNDYFTINGKQMSRMPKNVDVLKIKSPSMIYADFDSI